MKISIIRKKITQNLPLIGILLISVVLRSYNYSSRWALAYDQAWFAVIGRYALTHFQLPLLGPFASGGPFQTGGEWFWIVMIGTLLNPFSVISPWIFITFLSVLQVYLLYILGREFINKNFGLLVALLGAVSISQVLQATNLTSQMTTSICASILIFGMIRYLKEKKEKYLFIAGFGVGIGSAIHLQGVLLVIPLIIFILATKSFHPKRLLIIFLGLLIPWLPVLLVDVQHNFYNTKNMLMYFASPQSQVPYEVLGRRWLTFLSIFVPTAWGRVVGGNIILGYVALVIVFISFSVSAIQKKIDEKWIIILLTVTIETIVLRYVRTPLYENYITFLHPFIFLLIAFGLWWLFVKNKYLGSFTLVVFVVLGVYSIALDVSHSTNFTAIETSRYVDMLKQKFPQEKFAVYDYEYHYTNKTLPLVLYLETAGLIDDNGRKIGMTVATSGAQVKFIPHKVIDGEVGAYQLFDLSSSSSAELGKAKWALVNPSIIYDSVENWYKLKK